MDVTLMPIVFLVLFLYVFGGVVAGSTNAYLESCCRACSRRWPCSRPWAWARRCARTSTRACSTGSAACRSARSAPLLGAVLGRRRPVLRGHGRADRVRLGAGLPLPRQRAEHPGRLRAWPTCSTSAVCWVSVLVGLVAPSPQTVQGIAFIWTMPLVFGSSVLLANTASMPGWLQAWVKVNPVTHLADSVRALTIGGPVGTHVWYTLVWAAGIVLVTFPVAMRMYARQAVAAGRPAGPGGRGDSTGTRAQRLVPALRPAARVGRRQRRPRSAPRPRRRPGPGHLQADVVAVARAACAARPSSSAAPGVLAARGGQRGDALDDAG